MLLVKCVRRSPLATHPTVGPQPLTAIYFISELDIISRLERQREYLHKKGLIFSKAIYNLKMRVLIKSSKDSVLGKLSLAICL